VYVPQALRWSSNESDRPGQDPPARTRHRRRV